MEAMSHQLLGLGVDGKIHCYSVYNKQVSSCECAIPSAQINPDFRKLPEVVWCYECSDIIDKQDCFRSFSYER